MRQLKKLLSGGYRYLPHVMAPVTFMVPSIFSALQDLHCKIYKLGIGRLCEHRIKNYIWETPSLVPSALMFYGGAWRARKRNAWERRGILAGKLHKMISNFHTQSRARAAHCDRTSKRRERGWETPGILLFLYLGRATNMRSGLYIQRTELNRKSRRALRPISLYSFRSCAFTSHSDMN